MFKIPNKNKSFTLVESLVVIVIIVILSLIILPSYNSMRQQLAFQRSASKLAQDIRKVQEMAMSAQEFDGNVPEGGYGIRLSKTPSSNKYYILFADTDNNKKYDPGTDKIKEIYFEQGIKIKDLSEQHINIIFKPPDPEVYLLDNDAEELGSEVIIVICLTDDESKTKTIKINKAGLIYVE